MRKIRERRAIYINCKKYMEDNTNVIENVNENSNNVKKANNTRKSKARTNTRKEKNYTDAVFSKEKGARKRTNFTPTVSRTTRKNNKRNTNKNVGLEQFNEEVTENKAKNIESVEVTDLVVSNSNLPVVTNRKNIRRSRKNQVGAKEEVGFKKETLKIIPLGGLQEIGKNITVFEYGNDIVIVDCGVSFPEDDMLGIDLVIPDFTYLVKNREKIRGLVITHGHEDHIGSIPYFLKELGNVPIYATKLTVGLIENKLEEHHLKEITKLKTVKQGQTIVLGKMRVEFIRSSHSIPDAVALAIHTPVGTVVHTGDFKIDYTPIDDARIDLGRLAELGNKGVLALLSDSTNSERKGYTMSESTVGEVFDKLFFNCKKRIVVATFASNVHRVQQIVDAAVENNRKIAVCGRSMINMIETAIELGYIKVPKNVFIDIDMVKNYTDEQLVIITTGSQGEAMSALTRMATGEHKKANITSNDLVIIPANREKVLQDIQTYIEYLKTGICNYIDIFEPEVVCFGGSFAYWNKTFLYKELISEIMKPNATFNSSKPDFCTASYSNDAGIIGATIIE